jgi:hypothetical protein
VSELRRNLDARVIGLRTDRYSWWVHWRELADYILPRRYKWLVTPNQWNRGSPLNQFIVDSTGTLAARTLASGMMSGITSPTRPWFRLGIQGFEDATDSSPVKIWLEEIRLRMMRVFQESNYYSAKATQFFDLVVFGTAPMLIYEDFENVIRCYNPCAGEYYLASSPRFTIDSFYREFTLTIKQVIQEFGEENVTPSTLTAWKTARANWNREIKILHAIEPNIGDNEQDGVARYFPYREVYWEWGSADQFVLRQRGFYENPAMCPRWDLVSNDAYGRSPAMDALGDIKQLQQETKRKAQAIDKMVNPPLLADVQLKNQPASVLPGGITYVTQLDASKGMRPVYEVQPRIGEMMQDIAEIQQRIKAVFFNDLFLMISQLDTVRTATEIDARREEKLVMLGPVLERFQNESLSQDINRVFNIMERAKLLPKAPPEIQGQNIEVNYVSMLAEAQRAASTSGMERLMAQLGNLSAVKPDVLDNIDFNEFTRQYAEILHVPPKIVVDAAQVMKIQQQRAQAAQQAQQPAQVSDIAKSAKVLSETDVGGGQNALQKMTGL